MNGNRVDPVALEPPLHQFELFALLRLLERQQSAPGVAPIGTSGPARNERLRLAVSSSLAFPASDLAGLNRVSGADGIARLHLQTHFFGLVGTDSPLPATYATEVMLDEDDNPQVPAFLNLFHHRFLSLLYRAWLSQRALFSAEPGGTDPLSRALLSLISLTPETPSTETGLPPEHLLRLMGGLLLTSRPPGVLAGILTQVLGLSVSVRPLEPRRLPLGQNDRFRLGRRHQARDPQLRGQPTRTLHHDILLGKSMTDRSGHVVLRIGAVPRARLRALSPGGESFLQVVRFSRFFLQHPLQVTLELEVLADEIPRQRLGRRSTSTDPDGVLELQLNRLALLRRARTDPVLITFVCPEPGTTPPEPTSEQPLQEHLSK